jgi:ankyrin repeat protein
MNHYLTRLAILTLVIYVSGCGNSSQESQPADGPSATSRETATAASKATFLAGALAGKLDAIEQALQAGTPVDCVDENQRTALMLAAFNGHVDCMKALLKAGANANHSDLSGRTPLMFAATGKTPDAVLLLLNHGADVNRKDSGEGWTPLMWASAEGNLQIVKLLIQAGANVSITDSDGDNARTFALQNGHGNVARLLAIGN